jgi:hypothetical protein
MTNKYIEELEDFLDKSIPRLDKFERASIINKFSELLKEGEVERSKDRDTLMEKISGYLEHKPECIRSQFTAGEPTSDGGYRQKFGDKWYEAKPIDKTPKCDCGLDEILSNK